MEQQALSRLAHDPNKNEGLFALIADYAPNIDTRFTIAAADHVGYVTNTGGYFRIAALGALYHANTVFYHVVFANGNSRHILGRDIDFSIAADLRRCTSLGGLCQCG
jgi:hypothetical protein